MTDKEIMREPRPEGPNATPNIVRGELQANSSLFVAGEIDREIIVPGPYAVENILFFVGPKDPVLSIEELNRLMRNMFRRISPDGVIEADIRAAHLHIGHLTFSEGIFVRETDVYVYPNQDLAREMFELRQTIKHTPLKSEDPIGRYQEYGRLVDETEQIPLERLKGFK